MIRSMGGRLPPVCDKSTRTEIAYSRRPPCIVRAFVAHLSSSSPKLSSLFVSSHHQCDASYRVCVPLRVLCVFV